MATQRTIRTVSRDMRVKQTEHLFQKNRELLAGLSGRWQKDAREYMATAERQLGGIASNDSPRDGLGDHDFKMVSQYFNHIISILNDAMGSSVDAAQEFIKDLKELETRIDRLPETRKMAGGTVVKTGMDQAKAALKTTIKDAIQVINKRIAALKQLASEINLPEGVITEEDFPDELAETKKKTQTAFGELRERFHNRASSRSATYAFLRGRFVKRKERKEEEEEKEKAETRKRRDRLEQHAKKLEEFKRKKIERELRILKREMLTAPKDTPPPPPPPPTPDDDEPAVAPDPEEQLEEARQRILRFFETPEREGGDGPDPPVPPRVIVMPGPGAKPTTPDPDPTPPTASTTPTPATVPPATGTDTGNMAEWAKNFIKSRNTPTTPTPTDPVDDTAPTSVTKKRNRRRRAFSSDEPLMGRGGTLPPVENIVPLVTSIDETLRRTIGFEEAQTVALNKIANLEDEQMRLAETQAEITEDKTPDTPVRVTAKETPKTEDKDTKEDTGPGFFSKLLNFFPMSRLVTSAISLLSSGSIISSITGLAATLTTGVVGTVLGAGAIAAIIAALQWFSNREQDKADQRMSNQYDDIKNTVARQTDLLEDQRKLMEGLADIDKKLYGQRPRGTNGADGAASINKYGDPDAMRNALIEQYKGKLSKEQIQQAVARYDAAVNTQVSSAGVISTEPTKYTGRKQQLQVRSDVANILTSESGLSKEAIAAIMGNMQQESSWNPLEIGDRGESVGLVQWRGPRLQALVSFAREYTNQPQMSVMDVRKDHATQVRFMLAEMGLLGPRWKKYATHSNVTQLLNNKQKELQGRPQNEVIGEMTKIISSKYEVAGVPHIENRIKGALQAKELLNMGTPTTVTPPQTADAQSEGRQVTTNQLAHAALAKEIQAGNVNLVKFDNGDTVLNRNGGGDAGGSQQIPPPVHDRLPVLMPNRYGVGTPF